MPTHWHPAVQSRWIQVAQAAVAFHAGSKHNIISDRAELQITVCSDDEAVRKQRLGGIRRIAL